MEYSHHDLTSYCGLYCTDCHRLNGTIFDSAEALTDELESIDFKSYADAKAHSVPDMAHYADALKVLKAILDLCCDAPCRIGGGCSGFKCAIVTCCTEKGYDGCWECSEHETCTKFDFLDPYSGENRAENLRKIARLGIDGWVAQRKPFYRWQ